MRAQSKEGHAYLSRQFVRAIRTFHIPMTRLVQEVGISYHLFIRWADGVNRTKKEDPRVMRLAEMVGFQGQIFE